MIVVERYADRRKADFERLNREWIEAHFAIEAEDLRLFADPRGQIVERGGEIFFAVEDDAAIGTVAMIEHGAHAFELAKMAVTPRCRGRGIGRLLMDAALDFARARGKHEIVLLTNSALTPALQLYASVGFVARPVVQDGRFTRADVEMVLPLAR